MYGISRFEHERGLSTAGNTAKNRNSVVGLQEALDGLPLLIGKPVTRDDVVRSKGRPKFIQRKCPRAPFVHQMQSKRVHASHTVVSWPREKQHAQ
jgi:hypothetical protein